MTPHEAFVLADSLLNVIDYPQDEDVIAPLADLALECSVVAAYLRWCANHDRGDKALIRAGLMTKPTPTMDSIRKHNREAGQFFFCRETMRFFRSRVCGATLVTGPGGTYFVTSEQNSPGASRRYTVRQYYPETGSVGTAETGEEEFALFRTRESAARKAKELAKGKGA